MIRLTFKSVREWREWLADNHDLEQVVWLVYFKKESGIPTIDYNSSVEEALCYGWIDGMIRGIDEEKYMRRFTPRRETSRWSASNHRRIEKLIQAGKMTHMGMKKIESAKKKGLWDPIDTPKLIFDIPVEFEEALKQNPVAKEKFENLSRSHQKEYIGWIITAKREETRSRRIRKSITLLLKGEKLGMK